MPFTQTSSGLKQFDDINRASGNAIGNSWSEAESSAATLVISTQTAQQVARNTRNSDSTTQRYWRSSPAPVADMIFQSNIDHLNGSTGAITLFARSVQPVTQASVLGLFAQWSNPSGGLFQVGGGGAVECTATGVTAGLNGDALRLVVEDVGGGSLKCTGYLTNIIAGAGYLLDMSQTPVQRAQCTFASAAVATDAYGMAHARLGNSKMFFACGRLITVTGMPTGWKARLQPNTLTVVESGGTATLNVDAIPLPQVTIQILDGSDVLQFTLTPTSTPGAPGGVWGGDTYNLVAIPLAPTVLACTCNPNTLAIDLVWVDNSSNEDNFNIYRADDPAGPFSLHDTVAANVVSYADVTDLELDTEYSYRVTAINSDGESAATNIVTCQTKIWSDCLVAGAQSWSTCLDADPCGG